MEYEVVQDRQTFGAWRVEAIAENSEGECYVAVFTGPDSEARAREYAQWKDSQNVRQPRMVSARG